MEAEKTLGELSQLKSVTPWTNNTPFSSGVPLAPSSYLVWKQAYLMNPSQYGEGNSEANTHLSHFTPVFEGQLEKQDNLGDSNIVTVKTEREDTPIGAPLQVRVGQRYVDPESLDPKKLRTILSNRVSAQRTRLKKVQYVTNLENKAEALEAQVAMLRPRIEFFKEHKNFLQMEQSSLNQELSSCADEKIHKEAEIVENKKELKKLRLLQLKMLEEQMQRQARMYLSMGCGGSMNQITMVENPGFNQSENQLGRMADISAGSTQAQGGKNAREESVHKQSIKAEIVEKKPDHPDKSMINSKVYGNKDLIDT